MAYFQTKGVALITGAASGIGQGAANALAAAGVSGIAFADIDEERAQVAAEHSKKFAISPDYRSMAFRVNVANRQSVEDLVREVVSHFGSIQYLVNSAGVDVAGYVRVPDDDPDDFDRVMDVNAKGTLNVCRAVAKIMKEQETAQFATLTGEQRDLGRGVFLNVTSAASLAGVTGKVGYVSSKHAALGITRTLCMDLAEDKIRVNCICPTWVETPMFDKEKQKVPEASDIVNKLIPIGRAAAVDEIGGAIGFLCSPAASYVNGQALVLDAGALAGPRIIV